MEVKPGLLTTNRNRIENNEIKFLRSTVDNRIHRKGNTEISDE